MTVTNLTALIFAMGRQGGTIHQVATDLGLKPEEILNADEEKMEEYLRMAQRLNNLNNFRYRSNPNLDGQLPNRLTPSEVKALMIVLLSIAVFATAMVFGSAL